MIQDSSPITPPRELVYRLQDLENLDAIELAYQDLGNLDAIELAYQAGADQELEACCEWLRSSMPGYDKHYADYLHAARRPKPPSLKKQALAELELLRGDANAHGLGFDAPAIRRALEQLDD